MPRTVTSPGELLELMEGPPFRDVVRCNDHKWRMTSPFGQEVFEGALWGLLGRGAIRPRYSNTNDLLTIRETLDVDAFAGAPRNGTG